jgi:pilus assembly protein CpaF
MKDGSRRITHVTELTGMEGDTITLQDIYLYDHAMGYDEQTRRALGHLKPTGIRPQITERLQDEGLTIDADWFTPEDFAARGGRP